MAKNYNEDLGTFSESSWYTKSFEEPVPIPDIGDWTPENKFSSTITISDTDLNKVMSVLLEIDLCEVFIPNRELLDSIEISLTPPSGGPSRILFHAHSNTRDKCLYKEPLMTNAFYGLEAKGDWELTIKNTSWSDEFNIYNWKIKIFGFK